MVAGSVNTGCTSPGASEVYIRVNQLGFKPDGIKTGIVFSAGKLDGVEYYVLSAQGKEKVFTGTLLNSRGEWGKFGYNYEVDFSGVVSPGEYLLQVKNHKSLPFSIGEKIYSGYNSELLDYLRVQRCGPTNPYLHEVCHLFDSPYIVGDSLSGKVDVTGGWHDAGDYIKFTNTTAFTTYMLLFAYEFSPESFSQDRDNSGAPDILEEARVGLDWLLRCNYKPGALITQVQDLRDHEVGWRLPENDPLKYDRPAFSGMGKNIIGIYSAALAIGARIWRDKFYDADFSDQLISAARGIYNLKDSAPDLDKSPSGMYQDLRFQGKLALGAFELYKATSDNSYLEDSKKFASIAGPDYWWSWGDINSIAHYRLASIDPFFTTFIENNLKNWNDLKEKTVYRDIGAYTWGTTNLLFGVALNNILFKRLTGRSDYDSLAQLQFDYILGRNPWGLSFIHGIGKSYTKNFHSQVTYIKGEKLPGGIAAGPVTEDLLKNYNISRDNVSQEKFNSPEVKYYDDRNDYLTNEPTIVTTATALFVFGILGNR